MSYIPPHLRVLQDDKSRPRPKPEAPPSSSRRPYARSKSSKEFVPDVKIFKSKDYVHRFILLRHPSSERVKFVRFDGDTFAHLQDFQLYTLQAATTAAAEFTAHLNQGSWTQVSENVSSSSLLTEDPARFMFETLQEDFKGVLQKSKSVDSKSRSIRSLWLRFGKILFHSHSLFNWQESYTPCEVERELESRGKLLKTFDNGLSRKDFTYFRDSAIKHAIKSWSKEMFVIEVTDETRLSKVLHCVCEPMKHIEQPGQFRLELKKIRFSPVRHLIGDIACLGKSRDIRITLFNKEYLTGLTEEDMCDIKSSFSKVAVDSTAKGGLHWPVGSKQSTSGRFKVVGSMHEIKQRVICDGMKWSLQTCNRVEFKASSGRISYEVNVRPVIYRKFFESGEGASLEELMSSLEHLLRRVWTDYL